MGSFWCVPLLSLVHDLFIVGDLPGLPCIRPYRALPCPTLSYPALPYPTLPYATLPYATLSLSPIPVISYHIICHQCPPFLGVSCPNLNLSRSTLVSPEHRAVGRVDDVQGLWPSAAERHQEKSGCQDGGQPPHHYEGRKLVRQGVHGDGAADGSCSEYFCCLTTLPTIAVNALY